MRRGIALLPGAADFHNNLGALLQRTHRPAEAAEEFRRAVELRHDCPEAWNNLGAALEAVGDHTARPDRLTHRPLPAGSSSKLNPIKCTETTRPVKGRPGQTSYILIDKCARRRNLAS